ncbi:MAG: cytochrome c [Phycisphaerae bacterium]|nr:cytochrome c [Phycisphaerae bacterium]
MREVFPSPRRIIRRTLITAGVGGFALIVLALASCGPTAEQRYQRRLADTGKPAMHAIQNQRLKDLMHKLTFDPLSESEQGAVEEQRRADQLSEVATNMAQASSGMAEISKDLNLSANDRATYLSLVDKFRDQANAVGEAAKHKNFPEAKRSLERVQSTCNACHTLFRP